jgi:hypothetical protein
MNFFNPSNPMYRRSVVLLSTFLCTVTGSHVIMADFGSQEHVFSPIQRYVIVKADTFFEVSEDELKEAQRRRNEKNDEMTILNAELTSRLLGGNRSTHRPDEENN